MADEKNTVEMPKVPDWAVELTKATKEGIATLRADVAEVKIDVAALGESHKGLAERMIRSERRADEFEEWRARSSERAKSEEATRSKVDLEHSAQLVHLAERMEESFKKATESQTATILAAAAKTPQGQKLINAIVTFVLIALTVAGGWLTMHGGAK